jgi:DNA-binding Lrp family transcriptional regulator
MREGDSSPKAREMDAKDVRIFCQMAFKYADYNAFSERRISPTEISRQLGQPERTVRLRIKRMEEEGFIKFYQAIPNFNLFNLNLSMHGFEAGDIDSKHNILERFRNVPRVVEMIDFLGPIFAATLAGETGPQSEQYATKLQKEFGFKSTVKLSDSRTPPPSIVPSKLDWQILSALRYDALRSSAEIAKSIPISKRMVEYRISKMLDAKAFFVKAMIDVRKQRGIVFYVLTLLTDPAEKSTVLEGLKLLHGENLWTLFVPKDDMFIANLFAFSTGEPEDSLVRTLKLKGVRHGELSILREWLDPDRPSWIDKLIQERIDAK